MEKVWHPARILLRMYNQWGAPMKLRTRQYIEFQIQASLKHFSRDPVSPLWITRPFCRKRYAPWFKRVNGECSPTICQRDGIVFV